MSEQNKKYLIVVLLMGACLASIFLLIYSSGTTVKTLNGMAEADSLLRNDFDTFNIADNQIKVRTIHIDSANIRKEYRVKVPPGFSKTQLHKEIHDTFLQYRVHSPAKVIFPEKDFNIHLIADNSVFMTVKLKTDPDLVMPRSYGSILVAFDSEPNKDILDRLNELGEPIPIVLMIEEGDLDTDLLEQHSNIILWLKNEEGENIISKNSAAALPRLQHLQEITPSTGILSFHNLDGYDNKHLAESLSGTTLDFIDVSEAILLHADLGKSAFRQELRKFSRKAQRGEHPIAIVMGEEESIDWLQEELADFKKSGLKIVLPKKNRF